MIIEKTSWHYRWYAWWESKQRKPAIGQENLCHYMRVVLFWSWATWLMHGIGGFLYRLAEHTGRYGTAVGSWQVWEWGGWRYVGYGVVAVIGAWGILGVAYLIGLLIYVMAVFTDSFFFWTGVVFFCALGLIAVLGALAVLATVMVELLSDRHLPKLPMPRIKFPSVRPSMPSIIPLWWAWMLAKKHRICPFLTFEEEVPA